MHCFLYLTVTPIMDTTPIFINKFPLSYLSCLRHCYDCRGCATIVAVVSMAAFCIFRYPLDLV